MFQSKAFGVRLAEATNTCSLSWTTALEWRTAVWPSPWSTERGSYQTSGRRAPGQSFLKSMATRIAIASAAEVSPPVPASR